MILQATVQIDGRDVPCGKLYQNVRHGQETTSFIYDSAYLSDSRAFSLSPDMPLSAGTFHSSGLRDLRAFEDSMPDRWGRNLLLRAERSEAQHDNRAERTLFEADFLTGVNDETRQGALRIWTEDGATALAPAESGVPRETDIPSLLEAADLAVEDLDADVRDLVAAGSSLGGARPKASVRLQDGTLCVAKFPKADESASDDVCAWEKTTLDLMERCGIEVPASQLLRINKQSVLLTRRFDRRGDRRVPYISGLSAVQGRDGDRYSYLELVDFLEEMGSDPERDLPELWRRAAFSCAVGNTDNHLRNYGFLHDADGWHLSPTFDVNPTPGSGQKYLATSLDFDRPEADVRLALEVADYFRVSKADAQEYCKRMASVLVSWPKIARAQGISEASIKRMQGNFEQGIQQVTAALRNA